MWILKATKKRTYYDHGGQEETVATFDSDTAAREYLGKSYLKNITRKGVFKKRSILYGYDEAWIDWVDDPPVHNPVF